MTGKALAAIIACIVGLVAACGTVGALLFGSGSVPGCGGPLPDSAGGAGLVSARSDGWPWVGRFDAEQVGHAATIANVGIHMGVPTRGLVIAVATAIQESDLRNITGGLDDSTGLFQQRPSQGWGTAEQLRDPVYAAGKFYEKLLTVPGWQQMPLTEAAQAVQRSAYPDAYARHEPDATLLVNSMSSQAGASAAPAGNCGAAAGPWTQPVLAPIVSGFRTAQRPTHHGVDLGAQRGTPIKAAAAGTVTVVRCNVVPESHGCDVDGSPSVRGCGWYVDIEHADAIVTRYCHMLVHPYVQIGQSVAVGQVIGVVGTSGNSSGPHLHFEVHVGGDHSSHSATDPVQFMALRCAPLGPVNVGSQNRCPILK
jgi:murein DD-endopeptidase MepM/ murein hydrolase activator NlpD